FTLASGTLAQHAIIDGVKQGVKMDEIPLGKFVTGIYAGGSNPASISQQTGGATDGTRMAQKCIAMTRSVVTDTFTSFNWVPKKSWNAASTITLRLRMNATATGNMVHNTWATAFSNGDSFAIALGTPTQQITTFAATSTFVDQDYVITIANTPAKGDIVTVQISRAGATATVSDTTVSATNIMAAWIIYTIDAADDS
ncbi:MAG: hypothetical protein V4440_03380, partial [Pseudomonadota bacterium]